ncbi:MAG: ribosome silencing factor [Phycisphaerae bacterium]|nr:ribosome silencing factor [Phycisphaerae bacterium]
MRHNLAKKLNSEARDFVLAAARLADERHCSNIVILDLKGKSPATDYFVIATGTSDRQGRSVADEICKAAREQGRQRFGSAGYEQGRWILLDYVDVVIHIFDAEYRDYYDLELLWGDAKRLKWEKPKRSRKTKKTPKK